MDTCAGQWYLKRIKRIFVPYELFLLLLLVVHILCGRNVMDIDWFWLALGLQGSVVGVLGAEQTWFITPLLICYAVTPVLKRYVTPKLTIKQVIVLCAFAIGINLVWALPEKPAYSTIMPLLSYYTLAYILGVFFDKITLTKSRAFIAFAVMCVSFGIRLVARHFFDGTVLYDRIACGYTQALAAFCIVYIFAVAFEKTEPPKFVNYISSISFEIYLVHYMFCVGPVSLFGLTSVWAVNCIVVTVVSVLIAMMIHEASERIIVSMR